MIWCTSLRKNFYLNMTMESKPISKSRVVLLAYYLFIQNYEYHIFFLFNRSDESS